MTSSEKRSPRGPYAGTPARRAAIVQAARESFVEHGYDEASLRDIARRAGLSHPGLLHHFKDKAELLDAVLRERDDAGRAAAQHALHAGASRGAVFAEILRRDAEEPEVTRLWTTLAAAASNPAHPAHEYFTARYARQRQEIERSLTEREDVALPADIAASDAAALVLATLSGLQLQALLDPDLDVIGPLRRFVDLLFGADPEADAGPGAA
ncbi:MAG TPA: helix-turn-helix domain-containing protein [Solirubrobacteraceae bacterium]|nr:helix-turn-helix domain-containing protein [Solirubrobacteraceae bacterium]